MSVPLARYLKDFGAPQPKPLEFVSDFDFSENNFDLPEVPLEPAVDIEEEKSKARAEGYEAASLEMTERHEQQLAQIAAEHRAEIEALTVKYEGVVAERVEAFLKEMKVSVADAVDNSVARVLRPFVQEEVARAAGAKFAADVAEEIGQGRTVKLSVRGSETFIEMMRKRLDPLVTEVEYGDSAEIDMTLEVGDSILVTRLKTFVEAMEEQIDE
ncbi:hypothetical protein [Aliirhizobium smilacinae]|uniref:Uncharacterized protein n=1 Tax=Aliirhizobium smilacinae TaxID=1395944 RepID=A0A5C4XTS0_9HYPH|nr:hypothetical protein [Rhizobium smilacinae]TNM66084.1 hypothetical protein FHP24_07660 [Rhizobium smilacinae]